MMAIRPKARLHGKEAEFVRLKKVSAIARTRIEARRVLLSEPRRAV